MIKLKIEKLVEGGQGIGYSSDPAYAGQSFFVWEVLPNEEVEADITNKRKGIYEAKVSKILKASPHRIQQTEEHFLSCSPWQIMDFDYENEIKRETSIETYQRIGKISEKDIEIFSDNNIYGYRNKMEYSFIEDEGKISLAFFKRGQNRRIAIDECELANPAINKTAKKILEWINQSNLTERNLKALIIRSNKKGETVAGLFIKDKMEFDKYPELNDSILGFNLYYSTHKSPASVITEVLYQTGQDFLTEEIDGVDLKYGINSFFQVNTPIFEAALTEIKKNIPKGAEIIDFYSGVGTIGLALAKSVGSVTLVESNEEAVAFAEENIRLNKIKNVGVVSAPAEKALEYIKKDKTIVFDPPRAGLHEKVVEKILEVKPSEVIYLSCNVATQSRDIGLLKDAYNIEFIKLYNFFPRTPHIESLVVLKLIK
jgi:23S rRNA (uracil1939-C5)-methyltransferase